MSAIDELKAQISGKTLVPGDLPPPILRASRGDLPIGLIHVILELVTRVEELERQVENLRFPAFTLKPTE